jgi:Domain of unknown function (DUF4388)
MSLKGVLSDFPVSDVFQLIAQQRKTGVLRLDRGDRSLEVFFLDGEVLRASPAETRPDGALADFLLRTGAVSESALAQARRTQDESLEPLADVLLQSRAISSELLTQISKLVTHDTIFELFLWDDGRFEFRAENVAVSDLDEPVNAEMFLLDALRMRDEWANVVSDLPDLSSTASAAADLEGFRQRRADLMEQSGLDGDDLEKLFNLVNGRIAIRRVIDLSRLGTFRGGRGVVALLRGGLLNIEAREEPEPDEERDEPKPERGPMFAGLVALAVAALVAVGVAALPERFDPRLPLPSAGLEGARLRAGSEALRAALEAHLWLEGSYPETLESLRPANAELLAAFPPHLYSYARLGSSYELSVRSEPQAR